MNTNTVIIESLKKAAVFTNAKRKYVPILKYAHMNGAIEATDLEASFRACYNTGTDMLVEPKAAAAKLLLGETLKTEFSGDFPDMKEAFRAHYLGTAKAEDLHHALSFVRAFQSSDATRYNLNGVLFEMPGTSYGFDVVGCDGHRLGKSFVPMNDIKGECKPMIVPNVDKLLKVMPKAGEVTISVKREKDEDPTHVVFVWLNRDTDILETVSLRLCDGTYPDYRQVIPNRTPDRIVSHLRKPLLDKVKLVMSAANATAKGNTCGIVVDIDTARLKQDGEWSLNARYVREALQSMKTDCVLHRTFGEGDPQEILSPESMHYVLIMPVRNK